MKLIPTLCLVLLMASSISSAAQSTENAMNETLKTIHNRKSVRTFSAQKVSKEQTEILLKAAMAAPSSKNNQPWCFYAITNPEMLKTLSERLPFAKMVANAPLAIVVCGDNTKGVTQPDQALNWALDCSAAAQNLLLAAESMGLGATWTGVFPYKDRVAAMQEILGLPSNIIPLNLIPVGYPAGDEKPKDKYKPENIRWIE